MSGAARPRERTRSDVIVLGAGLSGLHAAGILAREGAEVTVIEARDRVGGRLLSFRQMPGNPEMGGDSILSGYGRLQSAARAAGVELVDDEPRRSRSRPELALGGAVIPRAAWPSHPLNAMPADARDAMPGRAFFERAVVRAMPQGLDPSWYAPANARFEQSAYDFMRSLGWSEQTIELNYELNIARGTSAHDASMLMWYFLAGWFRTQGDLGNVALRAIGGNSSIPEALARALPRPPLLGRPVVGVRNLADGVEVHCADGSVHRATRAICSLPLPPLRHVRFDTPLSAVKSRAIRTVPSMQITKMLLRPKRPFWEADGLDPGMWTDTAAGVVRPLRQGADAAEVTTLMTWARGHLAHRLDTLGPEAAQRLAIAEIEKLRPAAKGLLEPAGFKSWHADPWAGGTWSVWAPGQPQAFLPALGQPEGRLHFCGEHTALSNRGMEGAMESAERVALEVLSA